MRHVVLQGPDTMELVIPNSKLNGMRLRNMSRPNGLRSIFFQFNVAYHTDVDEASAIIRRAVEESPCAVPGKPGPDGVGYAPVYFLEYTTSSLVLATTVYYTAANSTEAVKSDINTRVKRALEAAGIEIPYNYVNVVVSGEKKKQGAAA
jgi:small-conductance mechanosensitive channel